MGRCKEWAKVVGDEQVDARVLAMRHKDLPYVPKLQKATKPERVMTYRSAFSPDLPLIQGGREYPSAIRPGMSSYRVTLRTVCT